MTFRQKFKLWLYGSVPGFAGAFPYFGTHVYFPPSSTSFLAACAQGIFEAENVRTLLAAMQPDTWFLDIGTNIGLISLPILASHPGVRVLSFEPSPNVLPHLQRTIAESPFGDRWTLLPKAVSDAPGRLKFCLSSPENSFHDGLRSTARVPTAGEVEVEVTTVDLEWKRLGSPKVSAIKCDVEGAELSALRGALECLDACRPEILLEWNAANLAAYSCPPDELLRFAKDHDFELFALPALNRITDSVELRLNMARTESFLLAPRG
jgi:FkbM family methyltransferase